VQPYRGTLSLLALWPPVLISSVPTFSLAKFHRTTISTGGKLGFTLVLLLCTGAACSLTVWQTACHSMHYMVELLEAVAMQQVMRRYHMHEHEQQLTNTCVRCNMYTPPSNSSMHSHMRSFAYRPTPIYLSSNLSLKSQFLWLGFPFCAFVAGHNT